MCNFHQYHNFNCSLRCNDEIYLFISDQNVGTCYLNQDLEAPYLIPYILSSYLIDAVATPSIIPTISHINCGTVLVFIST